MRPMYRHILLTAALLVPLRATTVFTPAPTRAATTSALDFRNHIICPSFRHAAPRGGTS